ncbi:DNA mismatch repair protein MutS [Tautonia sociabilis]|uniref:DNA mismatch repair protein MutS n=1 Tax=Tautonia sociabilis TaxID=2080755 RepID=A0A432MLW8_9BACT|nr:DNA mismatch repair protein MutS [Tautonia sociabilis]
MADARLGVSAIALVLAVVALGPGWVSAWWLLAPAAAFVGLVIAYDAIGRRRRRVERRVAFYEAGLDRLGDRWPGRGDSGERFLTPDHPFDADLDLFGTGSLFERLCTARTGAGKATLAHWLLRPADPAEIRARQEAIAELKDRLDLREDIALLGDDVERGLHPAALIAWGEQPPGFRWAGWPLVVGGLATLNLAALASWIGGLGGLPLFGSIVATLILGRLVRLDLGRTIGAIDERADELRLLSSLLERIEQEPFSAPRLRTIRATSGVDGEPPSREIARLARLATLLEFRRNQLFAPIAFLTLWTTHLALAIERWRARSGRSIERWLDAVGQFEALCALASYAFECPNDPFPEILPEEEGPIVQARSLGHPLIPSDRVVRNDLALGGPDGPRVLLVSGSNMSGKSTLMRSLGVNVVLALAGAPVRAASMRLSPLQLGATLRVQDSLQAGRSRFYAEITRLRTLVDLASSPPPLLFLLDEILHGTNSHDRRSGAEGVIKGLLDRGAIGLVTTHDLALAEIVASLGHPAENVHFEDHLENGEIRFDYVMRPGVVRKSNALALMRAVGLEV